MATTIDSIQAFSRRIPPPRIDFTIAGGQSIFPEWMRRMVEVRVLLRGEGTQKTWGCSADWPSFLWLDKREGVQPQQKLVSLLRLILAAEEVYLQQPEMGNPFQHWLDRYQQFCKHKSTAGAVPLAASFAISLVERAVIDAVCRLRGKSFARAMADGDLGFDPSMVHRDLQGFDASSLWQSPPQQDIAIRHTVGITDPIDESDCANIKAPSDGLPVSLRQVVEQLGIRHFKIKVRGNVAADLARIKKIAEVIRDLDSVITLDGNESFASPQSVHEFLTSLQQSDSKIYSQIAWLEQPLRRSLIPNSTDARLLQEISRTMPLLLDEGDDTLTSFVRATEFGYRGVSHKNCKGIFKSLANFAWIQWRSQSQPVAPPLFLSAEDLTCMPVVSLQQDLAVDAFLQLPHSERNAQHYFNGLQHLKANEQSTALSNHPQLFCTRPEGTSLRIDRGRVDLSELVCPGLGIASEPDWSAMEPLKHWIKKLERDFELAPAL